MIQVRDLGGIRRWHDEFRHMTPRTFQPANVCGGLRNTLAFLEASINEAKFHKLIEVLKMREHIPNRHELWFNRLPPLEPTTPPGVFHLFIP